MADIITARIDFYPCNGGMFEDCAAEFRIETEPADRGVGINRPTAEARFLTAQIGAFEVDRKTLIAMLTSPERDGLAEVEEIEARVAEDYEAEFYDAAWAAE